MGRLTKAAFFFAGHEMIAFERDFAAPYEQLLPVAPRIRRLLANNPGPFTFKGTGVYVVGSGRVMVIDPGPDDPRHLEALRSALTGETVSHILITHTHRDHSPAARALKAWTGAPTYGFGPHGSGQEGHSSEAEEGGDLDFVPDIAVRHGDVIAGDGFSVECVHTPGHTSNHVCYALKEEQALFSGDHVMGWSTTVIVPPDGDMGYYLASLKILLARDDATYWPTHGGPIREPHTYVSACLAHRLAREDQVLAGLRLGDATVHQLVKRIYTGLDGRLVPAASLTILAHLIQMTKDGRTVCDSKPSLRGRFALRQAPKFTPKTYPSPHEQ